MLQGQYLDVLEKKTTYIGKFLCFQWENTISEEMCSTTRKSKSNSYIDHNQKEFNFYKSWYNE